MQSSNAHCLYSPAHLQDFIYHQPYLTINMFWVIFPIAGIGLAIGTAIGVFILFAVQVSEYC